MSTSKRNEGDYTDRSLADAADNQREQRHLNEAKTKRRVMLIAVGVGLLGLGLIGVLAAGAFTPPTLQPKPGATATRTPEATNPDGKPGQTVITGEQEFWEADGKAYAVDLEKWQLAPAPTAPTPEDFAAVEQRYAKTPLSQASMTLPSEASGFTMDVSQYLKTDGTKNDLYTYWTAEQFARDSAFIIEKLINPRFGGWEVAQYDPAAFSAEGLSTVFTPEWWSAHGGTPADFPVYVDWGGNAYGMGDTLLPNGTRWMGESTDIRSTFEYSRETQQYTVYTDVDVRYTAWTQAQEKVMKDATLHLTLVANTEENPTGSPLRVLVADTSLEVR